jgi:putative transposase
MRTMNSFIEYFNGYTRWSMSLDDARSKMEAWRRDYNEVRPHGATGNKAPISLLNGSSALPGGVSKTPENSSAACLV